MGLDYTDGCINFRDIGGYVNLIMGKTMLREGCLFRGGSIDYVDNKGNSYWAYFNQIEKVEINPEFDYEYKVSKWCGTDEIETDAQLQPFFEKKETNDEEWYEDMIYWS